MPITRRLNTVLVSGLSAVYVIGAIGFHWHLQEQYEQELKATADRQMDVAQAIRQFTSENVREILLKDQDSFHPASVPSFAANQTMQYLPTLHPGQRYREVALNPMNLENKAKDWEVDAIGNFVTTAGQEFSLRSKDGQTMHFARPIAVQSPACLGCHGHPADAPRTVRARYGDSNGYGWQLGDVIGAQVVSVPTIFARERQRQHLVYYLATSLLALIGVFLALRSQVNRRVLGPMQSTCDTWRKIASEDPLTGAATRRSVLDFLELLINGSTNRGISVIFVDIDHFKKINDCHGHLVGDQILRDITQRIKDGLRESDVIGRYGGEELLIVLPACICREAENRANALRKSIAGCMFTVAGSDGERRDVCVTASFGVAQWAPGETANHLLVRADCALYRAKADGRDRVRADRVNEGAYR